MARTLRSGTESTATAFLTMVEPDLTSPAGYRAQAIHPMTTVMAEAYPVDRGRGCADQILLHFVTGRGRRIATLSLNEPAVLAISGLLGKAACLIGRERDALPPD
jgi:hypothetical protein